MIGCMLNWPDGQHTQHAVSEPADTQQRCRGHAEDMQRTCRGHADEMHWKRVSLTLRKYTQTLSRTPNSM